MAEEGENALEIIFVSWDRNKVKLNAFIFRLTCHIVYYIQEEFDNYYATMPWAAIPLGSSEINTLATKFQVQGIPTLVDSTT